MGEEQTGKKHQIRGKSWDVLMRGYWEIGSDQQCQMFSIGRVSD